MNFCHLHNHNEYSQLDGVGTAKDYASEAKRIGYEFLGVSNHGNVDGCIKFQKACTEKGIKSVIGCEFYIVEDIFLPPKEMRRFHICCFAKDIYGWQNMMEMLTIANLDGFYRKPRIDKKILIEHCGGLKVTSACPQSFIRADWGEAFLRDLLEAIGQNNLFLEIMPHDSEEQVTTNKLALALSGKYSIKLVASNDCHYPTSDGALVQEVLLAIQRKSRWNDKDRWRFDISGLFLKTPEAMLEAFVKQGVMDKEVVIEAMHNAYRIAQICSKFTIEKMSVVLPRIKQFEDEDETELLIRLSRSGLSERIIKRNSAARPISEYLDRMDEELDLICELGFQRYFLIVFELINWCKGNGILTGPGRGSVGGSLVAYLLGITNVDPLQYGLIFSRFISPARIDLPDIDMDFEDEKRHLVRTHLEDLYGKDNVAGMSTFMTMKGRGALRDVARVFEIPDKDVDSAAKSIVVRSGGDFRSDFSIVDAFETFEDGIEFKKKYPQVTEIAIKLEGQVRGSGQHAAAVCVSSESLKKGVRCNLCKRSDVIVVNWDKEDSEYMGLMKLDILGLSALTILSKAREMIKRNHNININFDDIPLDDAKVYEEISKGHTVGAFQIGSMGLSSYCKELGIEDFDMLVHATSLWRPGTLRSGLVTEFVERKKGKPYEAIHPKVNELTKDTFGIIVYQEQVMRFMYELGGLPWKTCDTVRKVISKSQGEELFMKYGKLFVEGCEKLKTLDTETATKVWKELSGFGSYGFNKAHAVEYSLITYYDMFLKTHYTPEFMACLLTYGNIAKREDHIREARRLGLEIMLPKVDKSSVKVWEAVPGENKLYAPLTEIKGIGEKTAIKILEKRAKAKYGFFHNLRQHENLTGTDLLLRKIEVWNEKTSTPQEAEYLQQFFQFNISSDPMQQIKGIYDLLKDKLTIIEEVDFAIPSKEFKLFFGQIPEIKFGYRHSVLKNVKGEEENVEFSRHRTEGTAESLGGVYGFFKDKSPAANAMLVFNSSLYSRQKQKVEHCGGKWMLIEANYPRRATNNLFCDKMALEEDLVMCNFDGIKVNLVNTTRDSLPENLFPNKCSECSLLQEARGPVPPSRGNSNIAIIGEAPGKDEDIIGQGFVGKAGDVLWDELGKHSFNREFFYITNVVKCFPSKTKTPSVHQVDTCSSRWLDAEIREIKPILVLALGNSVLKYFSGKEGGITQMNGITEWDNKRKLWICWCIHPASVLYQHSNLESFRVGIENFVRCIKAISQEDK